MGYRVISAFADLRDDNHVYQPGDKYPRSGKVDQERAKELSGAGNRLHKPLIEFVPDRKGRKRNAD